MNMAPVPLLIPGLQQPLRLQVHGEQDRHVSRRIREQGIWEPYETSLLLQLLGPGGVMVDVGANIGYFTVIAASVVGAGGSVFAFEPDTENFRLLQENLRLNQCERTVTAVEAGLAAHNGAGELFLSEDNAGDHQVFDAGDERRSRPVRLLNGSDWLDGKVRSIDMLKVDVQGAEYDVMAGLMPLLRSLPRLPHILLELTPLSLRQAGSSGRLLVELLAELGQPLWIVDHIAHRLQACPASELAQWCDDVDAVTGDAGFMNILAGTMP
jgi:FkbM family methyltransferase